jgi:cytochrome c-type biogenesis protein CcmH/NrfG
MNYWKGLLVAVVFDVAWIAGIPSPVTEATPLPMTQARQLTDSELREEAAMHATPEDAQLDAAGRLEDSLMVYLQTHSDDVGAMVNLARMYVAHGWYDAAIGPLARAVQLDSERRSAWSLLDRSLKMTGKTQATDAELTKRARQFEERVAMWGEHC